MFPDFGPPVFPVLALKGKLSLGKHICKFFFCLRQKKHFHMKPNTRLCHFNIKIFFVYYSNRSCLTKKMALHKRTTSSIQNLFLFLLQRLPTNQTTYDKIVWKYKENQNNSIVWYFVLYLGIIHKWHRASRGEGGIEFCDTQ